MKATIEFTRSAAKTLADIPKRDRKQIQGSIDCLCENFPDPKTTKMAGDNPFHRVYGGDYRIIYELKMAAGHPSIVILKIGHCRETHRRAVMRTFSKGTDETARVT